MNDISLNRIQEMAIETAAYGVHPSGEYIYSFYTEQLQAFARLVAEHERNEIIEILDASTGYVHMDAIRERGNP
jgi:hypothetical protein